MAGSPMLTNARKLLANSRQTSWSEKQTNARKVLELPTGRRITRSMVQEAWRDKVKVWHPDTNPFATQGKTTAIRAINVARDILLRQIADGKAGTAPPAPNRRRRRCTLLITPEGHLFGDNDLYLGTAGTVAFAIAYCGRAGWKYELCNQLSQSQASALEARPKQTKRRKR